MKTATRQCAQVDRCGPRGALVGSCNASQQPWLSSERPRDANGAVRRARAGLTAPRGPAAPPACLAYSNDALGSALAAPAALCPPPPPGGAAPHPPAPWWRLHACSRDAPSQLMHSECSSLNVLDTVTCDSYGVSLLARPPSPSASSRPAQVEPAGLPGVHRGPGPLWRPNHAALRAQRLPELRGLPAAARPALPALPHRLPARPAAGEGCRMGAAAGWLAGRMVPWHDRLLPALRSSPCRGLCAVRTCTHLHGFPPPPPPPTPTRPRSSHAPSPPPTPAPPCHPPILAPPIPPATWLCPPPTRPGRQLRAARADAHGGGADHGGGGGGGLGGSGHHGAGEVLRCGGVLAAAWLHGWRRGSFAPSPICGVRRVAPEQSMRPRTLWPAPPHPVGRHGRLQGGRRAGVAARLHRATAGRARERGAGAGRGRGVSHGTGPHPLGARLLVRRLQVCRGGVGWGGQGEQGGAGQPPPGCVLPAAVAGPSLLLLLLLLLPQLKRACPALPACCAGARAAAGPLRSCCARATTAAAAAASSAAPAAQVRCQPVCTAGRAGAHAAATWRPSWPFPTPHPPVLRTLPSPPSQSACCCPPSSGATSRSACAPPAPRCCCRCSRCWRDPSPRQ